METNTSMQSFTKDLRKDLPGSQEDFPRLNQGDDALFYSRVRLVPHVDSLALGRIESLIDDPVTEREPAVLDLMAGWDSHWPKNRRHLRMVGLGGNEPAGKPGDFLSLYVLSGKRCLSSGPHLFFAGLKRKYC
ncbi:MAG: hypothetical protein AB1585_01925 [Thermodesulfobacteriota bacterium]